MSKPFHPDMPASGRLRQTAPPHRRLPLIAAMLLGLGLGTQAVAQGTISDAIARAKDVDLKKTQAPGLYLKPQLELEVETLRNRRLERDDIRRADRYKPAAILGLRWQGDGRWSLVNETELRYDTQYDTRDGTSNRSRLNINQLYGEAQLPEWNSAVRIGRWAIEDEREWLVDTELDGVQYLYQRDEWQATAFAARENRWDRDLLHDSRGDNTNFIGLMGAYDLGDRHHLALKIMAQRNSDDDLRLTHYTFGSFATPRKGPFQHWAFVSLVDGKDQGRKVRGQALDVGGTWMLSSDGWQPRVTLGYAWGSGSDGAEGTDKNHRQTGLQGNEGRFGGQASFKLYGDTLDPVLSNLHILTAGVGVAPGKNSSVDLVYHHYRQDKTGDLLGSNLRPRADLKTGRALGNALDVIWGWRMNSRLKLEAAAGMFQPDDRFRSGRGADAGSAGTAYSAWLEVKYRLQ